MDDRALTVVRLVAVTEARRTWRALRSSRSLWLYLLVGALGLLYLLGGVVLAYLFGRELRRGALDPAVSSARLLPVAALVFGTFLMAQRTVKQTGSLDAPAALLTAATPTRVAAGIVGAEFLRVLGFLAVPLVLTAGGFVAGTRDPVAGIVPTAVVLAFLAFVIAVGFTAGMAAKAVTRRSATVAANRGTIGFVLSLLAGGTYLLLTSGATADSPLVTAVQATPLGWVVDLALYPAPNVSVSAARALSAAGLLVAGTPLFAVVGGRLAAHVWLVPPPRPAEETAAAGGATPVERLLPQGVPETTQAVARKCWLRARRSPFTLQFALMPFLVACFVLFQATLRAGALPSWAPLVVAVAGAAATGGAFTLNLIGDEGEVLPLTLLSPFSAREFVAGAVVAGWLVGLPLTVVLTVATGVLVDVSPPSVLTAALAGVVLALAAPGVAAGIGVAFPKFETTSVRGGRETVVPSGWAFQGYLLTLAVVGAPALLTQAPGVGPWVAAQVGLSQGATVAGGLAVTASLAGGAAALGIWHAANVVAGYTPPSDAF